MRYAVLSVFLLLMYIVNCTLSPAIPIFGVIPNLVLITIVCYALISNVYETIIYAAAIGAISDLMWSEVFGLRMLLLIYVGVAIYFLHKRIYKRNVALVAAYVFGFTLVYELLFVFLNYIMWGNFEQVAAEFWRIIILESLFGALISAVIYPLILFVLKAFKVRVVEFE